MSHPLDGVRAKIERANEHLANLKTELQRGLDNGDYGFRAEDDPKVADQVLIFGKAPPELMIRYGLIAGDVCHNLRSALDHLAWQLTIFSIRKPTKRTQFPIFSDRVEYAKQSPAMIDGILPKIAARIERLQPYNTGPLGDPRRTNALWILHEMSNSDKHRVVNIAVLDIPALVVTTGEAQPMDFDALARSGVGRVGRVVDGALIKTLPPDSAPPDVRVNIQAPIHVAFDEVGPGLGYSVVPTLESLIEWVTGAVEDGFGDKVVPWHKIPAWGDLPSQPTGHDSRPISSASRAHRKRR
jgi:hypothetical protein